MERRAIKRSIARKVTILDLSDGEYVKRGGLEPNYFMTRSGPVSRVDIIAFVITNPENRTFMIDDGTGSIDLRVFDDVIDVSQLSVGDMIHVIGRPRHWNGSTYIVPEIIKTINDKRWLEVWQEEISNSNTFEVKKPNHQELVLGDELGPYQTIISAIEQLDSGDGADFEQVVSMSKVSDAEHVLSILMEEGEIYQIRPGKLKLLD